MTVEELINALVALAQDGKSQWIVSIDVDDFAHYFTRDIQGLEERENFREVVLL
jgi:hypothetical protein